jgi:cobalt-zinc-cadmium efflux system outer membrane protein
LLLGSGCLYQVRERTESMAAVMATQEFDRVQGGTTSPEHYKGDKPKTGPDGKTLPMPKVEPADKPGAKPAQRLPDLDVQTTSFLQKADEPGIKDVLPPKLSIPERIPGSEGKLIKLPKDWDEKKIAAEVRRLFPPLPKLPDYPRGAPGPDGKPYTLTQLHRLAMENSATVRQALADVETARGNMIQASMYPNPTVGIQFDPTNNNAAPGVYGTFFDQVIKTGGKLKLATAAAAMDLANAELALKRARSDLATNVRSNYFSYVVSLEVVQVTRALAQFTDEMYRLQVGMLRAGVPAPYEAASMRAQANMARLAYRQAIETYIMNWKQLAAAVNVRDLPLSQVAGQVDQLIPRYDFNKLMAHILRQHTDVLTARNGIDKQRYNLKLAQITPVPDVDVHFEIQKEMVQTPYTWLATMNIGAPIPIWDQNKGGIMAAEGTLARAIQEPRRVELSLTNAVANAYTAYATNLESVETYRRDVLPDFVVAYRGVYERRRIDPAVAFSDLLGAQQNLAGGVTSYLTALTTLWSSIVTLIDFAQIEDLFELGHAESLPPIKGLTLPVPAAPAAPAPVKPAAPAAAAGAYAAPPAKPAPERHASGPELPAGDRETSPPGQKPAVFVVPRLQWTSGSGSK